MNNLDIFVVVCIPTPEFDYSDSERLSNIKLEQVLKPYYHFIKYCLDTILQKYFAYWHTIYVECDGVILPLNITQRESQWIFRL